eukprot:915926-Amphidinium_carterae.1
MFAESQAGCNRCIVRTTSFRSQSGARDETGNAHRQRPANGSFPSDILVARLAFGHHGGALNSLDVASAHAKKFSRNHRHQT